MKSVVFCGGGTAGHVMPNIAVAKALEGRCNVYYIGAGSPERELTSALLPEAKFICCEAPRLRRKLSRELFAFPSRLMQATKQAQELLRDISPCLVVSKGGFASFPIVYAAHKLKLPVIAHESDSTLGLANRSSLPFIQALFTPYPSAAKAAGKKGILCPTPLSEAAMSGEKQKGLMLAGASGRKPLLLCLGGSLGAKALNDAVMEALPSLLSKFDVFMVCGKGKLTHVAQSGFKETEFTHELHHLYAAADIALARAGSNTIAELEFYKVPSLLVPLKKGSRGEQVQNAALAAKKGTARVLSEEQLTGNRLAAELFALYRDAPAIKTRFKEYRGDNEMIAYVKKVLSGE